MIQFEKRVEAISTMALRGHVTQLILFCYANKIFATQKSFFATLIKFLLRKKVFLLR